MVVLLSEKEKFLKEKMRLGLFNNSNLLSNQGGKKEGTFQAGGAAAEEEDVMVLSCGVVDI